MQREQLRAVRANVRDGVAPLIDFLYPPRCPVCGDATMDQGGLCTECWSQLEQPTLEDNDQVIAATLYNDVSRSLVLALKHGGRISLAGMMARLIAARLPEGTRGAAFVPVPLNRWRLWARGYNQSALIARELAHLREGELLVDALRRPRRTPSLGGMGAHQRRAVLAGSMALNPKARDRIAGRPIVLVDDVLTSGATSEECFRVLRDAGAARVLVACFARVT